MKQLQIVDLEGKTQVVTDLEAAIIQADMFRCYEHQDPAYDALSKSLQRYWQHTYEQLLILKENE